MNPILLFLSLAAARHTLGEVWTAKLPATDRFEDLCAQDAVAEYMEECSRKGPDDVDSSVKLRSAVQLSICEFRAANVDYPESCKMLASQEANMQCVQDFRKSSQLWTTYSGNWRKLRSACHEEAAPFIKSNILELFFNVTELFSQFYSSASASYKTTETFSKDAELQLNSTLQAIEKLSTRVESFEKNLSTLSQRISQVMESSAQAWDSISDRTDDFFQSFNFESNVAMESLQNLSEYSEMQFGSFVVAEEAILHRQSSFFDDHAQNLEMFLERNEHEINSTLNSALTRSRDVELALNKVDLDVADTLKTMQSQLGQVVQDYLVYAHQDFHELQKGMNNTVNFFREDLRSTVETSTQSLSLVSNNLEALVVSLQNVVTDVEALKFPSILPFLSSLKTSAMVTVFIVPLSCFAMCSKLVQQCVVYFLFGLLIALSLRACGYI